MPLERNILDNGFPGCLGIGIAPNLQKFGHKLFKAAQKSVKVSFYPIWRCSGLIVILEQMFTHNYAYCSPKVSLTWPRTFFMSCCFDFG